MQDKKRRAKTVPERQVCVNQPGERTDEMCMCGHLKSVHADTGVMEFKGACKLLSCYCDRFTWKHNVYGDN